MEQILEQKIGGEYLYIKNNIRIKKRPPPYFCTKKKLSQKFLNKELIKVNFSENIGVIFFTINFTLCY